MDQLPPPGTTAEKLSDEQYQIVSTNMGSQFISVELTAMHKAAEITLEQNRKSFVVLDAEGSKLVSKDSGFTRKQSLKMTIMLVPEGFDQPGLYPISAQGIMDRWPTFPRLKDLISGRATL